MAAVLAELHAISARAAPVDIVWRRKIDAAVLVARKAIHARDLRPRWKRSSARELAMPTTDLIALRNALAAIIIETKQSTPPTHHDKLDLIGSTLDMIPADAVPDFCALDASTNGAVSKLIREDIRSIANDGIMSSEITDARAFIRALAIFVDAIRTDEVEWIARRVRRTLDGKPLYDA